MEGAARGEGTWGNSNIYRRKRRCIYIILYKEEGEGGEGEGKGVAAMHWRACLPWPWHHILVCVV